MSVADTDDFREKMKRSIEAADKWDAIIKEHFSEDILEDFINLEQQDLDDEDLKNYEYKSVDGIIRRDKNDIFLSFRRLEYDEDYDNLNFRHYSNMTKKIKGEWLKWMSGEKCKPHVMIVDNYPERVCVVFLRRLVEAARSEELEPDRVNLPSSSKNGKRGSATYIDFSTIRDYEEKTNKRLMKVYDYEEIDCLEEIHRRLNK